MVAVPNKILNINIKGIDDSFTRKHREIFPQSNIKKINLRVQINNEYNEFAPKKNNNDFYFTSESNLSTIQIQLVHSAVY